MANLLERVISNADELQKIAREETGLEVVVEEFELKEFKHTHPATGEEFSVWGSYAVISIHGAVYTIDKTDKNDICVSAADASNSLVARIKTICKYHREV